MQPRKGDNPIDLHRAYEKIAGPPPQFLNWMIAVFAAGGITLGLVLGLRQWVATALIIIALIAQVINWQLQTKQYWDRYKAWENSLPD